MAESNPPICRCLSPTPSSPPAAAHRPPHQKSIPPPPHHHRLPNKPQLTTPVLVKFPRRSRDSGSTSKQLNTNRNHQPLPSSLPNNNNASPSLLPDDGACATPTTTS